MDKTIIIKCKVVYDFQSIEYEWPITTKEDRLENQQFFLALLSDLKTIADKIPNPSGKGPKTANNTVKKEPKASPNQIRWLKNLGVDEEEAKQMTTTEASDLIKELKEIANNG